MEQGDELPPGISAEDSIDFYENKPSISLMESHDEEDTEERTEDEDLYDDVNPLAGSDDDDDDDVQVTIGKIEPPVNVQFNKSAAGDRQVPAGKLDIDTIPMLNDKPIYDVDLATMDDRPWRKPGADITDYFNYGFTEDSWNTYCERQKKLRLEFTSQAAVNKAIFSNIHIANPLAMPSSVGGRQLVSLTDNNTTSNVKVLTDNGGRFKPHFHKPEGNDPIVRTVIGGAAIPAQTNSSNSTPATPNAGSSQAPIMDFSKPPPGMTLPPTVISSISQSTAPGVDAPPGVEATAVAAAVDGPPGVDIAPPGEQPIQPIGSSSMDMSVPPPGFNPAMPPPGLRPMGMPPTNMPPPVFNSMMPPPGFGMTPRFQQVPGMGRPPNMMHRGDYGQNARRESSDFDDRESEDERRRYRRRSRSRSPVKRDRKRDDREERRDRDRDRERERERERDRDRGKERDRAERSRRHRSRSASPETRGKKRSDDRDKKRERRDEDSDRKKSRRHEDDTKEKERSSRHRRSDKSKDDGDSKEDREPAPPGTEEAGNA